MTASTPPPSQEDWVPADDRVIGTAVGWSAAVVCVLAAGIGGVWWWTQRPAPGPLPVESVTAPVRAVTRDVTLPELRFADITTSAGIDFVHDSGATGDKLLPETMGGGCAVFDYDGDGALDLLFVNSNRWPDDPRPGPRPTMGLYRNAGDATFTNVTVDAGLAAPLYGMGPAVGDIDGDGDTDLFVTAVGSNRLYRNDDGRFVDITAAFGVAGAEDAWSTGAAFFDYDNDGDLDLWVCNYVQWSRAIDFAVDYRLVGVGRAYGVPTNFKGTHSVLYRNDGAAFTDVSTEVGIHVDHPTSGLPSGKALAVGVADFDRDGWLDVLVANDTVQNFLFRNLGDGTFSEIGALSGVAFDGRGNATGAMGTDVADFRNEGRLGCAIGNFANEMTSLYIAGRDGLQFTDDAIIEGIGAPSRHALTFGLCFLDVDLDGRLDLLQANGHLESEINRVQPSQHYRQPAQLFWNAGPGQPACFVEVPAEQLGDLARPIVGRGAAYGDLDGDGDLDIVLTQTGGPPVVLRNDTVHHHHWVRVRLQTDGANRDAIGAELTLTAAGRVQRRMVMTTRSYLTQVELPATFGLGTATTIERLEIRWPGGRTTSLTDVPVDRVLTIHPDRGLIPD